MAAIGSKFAANGSKFAPNWQQMAAIGSKWQQNIMAAMTKFVENAALLPIAAMAPPPYFPRICAIRKQFFANYAKTKANRA